MTLQTKWDEDTPAYFIWEVSLANLSLQKRKKRIDETIEFGRIK